MLNEEPLEGPGYIHLLPALCTQPPSAGGHRDGRVLRRDRDRGHGVGRRQEGVPLPVPVRRPLRDLAPPARELRGHRDVPELQPGHPRHLRSCGYRAIYASGSVCVLKGSQLDFEDDAEEEEEEGSEGSEATVGDEVTEALDKLSVGDAVAA
jgi:hypothetical protein